MTRIDIKDITEVSEATADATYISATDGSYDATIADLLELLEDDEDIREGSKALADEEDTVTWEQYQINRKK